MKKLMLAAAASGLLATGAAAYAQGLSAPECPGTESAYPTPCSPAGNVNGQAPHYYGVPGKIFTPYGYGYDLGQLLPQILADGTLIPQSVLVTPYPRTSRDRDGDGVRNRYDRFPDDPRYR